jgi:hypothetical protein
LGRILVLEMKGLDEGRWFGQWFAAVLVPLLDLTAT